MLPQKLIGKLILVPSGSFFSRRWYMTLILDGKLRHISWPIKLTAGAKSLLIKTSSSFLLYILSDGERNLKIWFLFFRLSALITDLVMLLFLFFSPWSVFSGKAWVTYRNASIPRLLQTGWRSSRSSFSLSFFLSLSCSRQKAWILFKITPINISSPVLIKNRAQGEKWREVYL